MIVLREPLTSVFYQYGVFSQAATDRTASTLAFFAVGLVGHIVVHVLTRAFYAMQDTRTPVTWAIVAVAINVPLMILLVGPMGVEGLALALSIAAVLEVLGLLWSLARRLETIDEGAIARSVGRAGLAALVAGAVMFAGLLTVEATISGLLENGLGRVLVLLTLAAAGGIAYLAAASLLRSPELVQLRGILPGRRA